MKRFLLSCAGVVALTAAAAAADLPARAPVPYYPVKAPMYAPPYSWTGFYLGVNGGYGWGRSDWDTVGPFDVSGGLVGGTAGYNYQFGQLVVGVEGDVDWSDIKGNTTSFCTFGCQTSNTWLSTVRGRLGFAADRFLPYVTGGAAFGDIRASTPGFPGASQTNTGWTVGAGIEAALVGNLSAKVEYLYVDLGNFNCGVACGLGAADNVSLHENVLRGGINYRF
jgi:outer membrane immunogenic protein